jgi:hypothetical protein
MGERLFAARARRREGQRLMIAAALGLLVAACASLVNTPAQDLAWTRWTACHAQVSGTLIRTVQMDGRISFWSYGPGDRNAMLECLRQAAKEGPALPEPVSDSLPRGP